MPVPYMNPYYFQNNPAYQPSQFNPMQNTFDQINQLRNQLGQQPAYGQMYQQPQQPQPVGLVGEIVDSIDVVNAKNVDLSGNITYYPKADQTEIYTKQLQPDGRSLTLVYRRVTDAIGEEKQVPITMDTLNNLLNQMKTEMVEEIRSMIPETSAAKTTKQVKGGTSE